MEEPPSLFAVVVGGYPPGAHGEVHDTRFVIGRELSDGFRALKSNWWGGPDRFHIDAWGRLLWADGHDIIAASEPPEGATQEARLHYVQLGGYRRGVFGELHRDLFIVAKDASEAKRRALAQAPEHWDSAHRDGLAAVEAIVDVERAVDREREDPVLGIFCVPQPEPRPFLFEARYLARLEKD
jgi:hypothetical protein